MVSPAIPIQRFTYLYTGSLGYSNTTTSPRATCLKAGKRYSGRNVGMLIALKGIHIFSGTFIP